MKTDWNVGSNGNWFRDMGGARYCVAYGTETVSVMRNGEDLGIAYPIAGDSRPAVKLAKAAAERDMLNRARHFADAKG